MAATAVPGQPAHGKNVLDGTGHRQDERADGVRVVAVVAQKAEQGDRLACFGRQAGQVGHAGGRQAGERVAPVGRLVETIGAVKFQQCLDGTVDHRRILADVERGGTEAEGRYLAAQRRHLGTGNEACPCRLQAAFQRLEVVQQFLRRAVGQCAARRVTHAGAHPELHGGAELAEQLAVIAMLDRIGLTRHGHQRGVAVAEVFRRRADAVGNRQQLDQPVQFGNMILQGVVAQPHQRAIRDGGGDVWVAVAVAADPRGKTQEGGGLDRLFRKMPGERVFEIAPGLDGAGEQRLVEEVQAPGHFLVEGGPVQAQLAGEQQELDLVANLQRQPVAFARRPAVGLQLHQGAVDPPVGLEHGGALGLGGVGGDGGRHLHLVQDALKRIALDATGGGVCQGRMERADDGIRPRARLDAAQGIGLRDFLGDTGQLEADADGLERLDQQPGVGHVNARIVAEQAGEPGLVHLEDAAQQAVQQPLDMLAIVLRAGVGRRAGALRSQNRYLGSHRRLPFVVAQAASAWRRSTSATVSPMLDGLGATVMPACSRIETFSWALSPKAEMIAPA